jgi:hypothetical protein
MRRPCDRPPRASAPVAAKTSARLATVSAGAQAIVFCGHHLASLRRVARAFASAFAKLQPGRIGDAVISSSTESMGRRETRSAPQRNLFTATGVGFPNRSREQCEVGDICAAKSNSAAAWADDVDQCASRLKHDVGIPPEPAGANPQGKRVHHLAPASAEAQPRTTARVKSGSRE